MASERQVLEMNARLIDIVQMYEKAGALSGVGAAMAAEIRTVARWYAAEARLGAEGIEERVLRPVGEELRLRYGPDLGGRLYAEIARHLRDRPETDHLASQIRT